MPEEVDLMLVAIFIAVAHLNSEQCIVMKKQIQLQLKSQLEYDAGQFKPGTCTAPLNESQT